MASSPSGRADAVEPLTEVGPKQVAHIQRVAGQYIGGNGNPSRTRQVGAGFDHRSLTVRPAHVKSELIAPDPEISILGQNHGKPHRGRASSEGACPTGFPRQVKNGRVGGAGKGALRNNGASPRKKSASRFGQPEKANCPMICVPLEIVTLARLVQE